MGERKGRIKGQTGMELKRSGWILRGIATSYIGQERGVVFIVSVGGHQTTSSASLKSMGREIGSFPERFQTVISCHFLVITQDAARKAGYASTDVTSVMTDSP